MPSNTALLKDNIRFNDLDYVVIDNKYNVTRAPTVLPPFRVKV